MRGFLALAIVCGLISSVGAAPKKPVPRPKALVLVIDRSGSMQGAKIDSAKAAALAAISTTSPGDTVAVVAFDSEAAVFVTPKLSSNRVKIAEEVAKITSGGGTNIFPGLKEAFEILQNVKVGTKHVILLSDGWAPTDGIADLVKEMHDANITISTVAVDGADETILKDISTGGGGRMHKVTDLKQLSATFIRETRLAFR